MIKRKGLLGVIFFALVIMMFTLCIFAEDITIEYYNGDKLDTSVANSGVHTIKAGESVTLPKKTVASGKSSNWYTYEGRAYEGGATVTFYESIKLYHTEATHVYTFEELKAGLYHAFGSWGDDKTTVKLMADIVCPETIPEINWSNPKLFLNGHTLTFAENVKTGFTGTRGGIQIMGSGTVKMLATGTGINLSNMPSHGYAGDYGWMLVGRDVYIDAPYANLMNDPNSQYTGYPYAKVYGNVNVKSLVSTSSGSNMKSRVDVFEQAHVVLHGAAIVRTNLNNKLELTVKGGTIETLDPATSFFEDGIAVYRISGGAFKFAMASDYDKLKELSAEKECTTMEHTVNGKTFTVVVPLKEGHNHAFTVLITEKVTCTNIAYQYNYCTECGHRFAVSYGEKNPHDWYLAEHVDPTKVKEGYDRFACRNCYHGWYEYITYDPRNLATKVTVMTANGEKIIDTTLGAIFEITSPSKSEYVIVGINAIEGYSIDSVLGATIPWGITGVSISKTNEHIKFLTFDDGCELTVTSMKALTALETINIGKCTVKFASACAPASVTAIKTVKSGGTVTFEASSFKDITALKELELMSGSTYSFGANSFQNTGFESLSFADGAVVAFSGAQAFYGCTNLKELYVGTGITQLNNKPFDCCGTLELIVLMDVTYISDYCFCASTSGANVEKAPLKFYSHATTSVTIDANAFANRNNHGVTVYMPSTNRTSFSSCKYELHYGIPHAYTLTKIEPTCTTEGAFKYVTDCVCQDNKSAIYKLYKSGKSDYEIVEMLTEAIPVIPHEYNTVSSLKFNGGFDKYGTLEYACDMCSQNSEEKQSVFPLVTFTGYSVSEFKSGAMTAGFRVDSNTLKLVEEVTGNKVEFGMVLAASSLLRGRNPLDNTGNIIDDGVFKLDMKKLGYYESSVKIANMAQNLYNAKFVMSGYISISGNILYIQGNGNAQKPAEVSYNQILSASIPAMVSSKEEY